MKKHLLFAVALSVASAAVAQNQAVKLPARAPKLKPEVANKIMPYKKQAIESGAVAGFQTTAQTQVQTFKQAVTRSTPSFTSTTIGESMYDLQTNASICNRIVVNADATIAATWTMSHDSDAESSPNRGTGYNYFNGTTWGTMPTARLESIRCGWPNIGVTGTGGEVVVSHEATGGTGNIHVLTRPVKGTGLWKDTTLGYEDVWPRMVVAGANGKSIHIISQTTGADSNPPFHGQDGAIAYSRSLDGGITWDKVQTVIPEIDSSHYLGFGGDSYAIDAKGDTIVIVAGGFDVDVVLLKSIDNGTSWTKTIVHEFPIPLYDAETMNTDLDDDGITDTIETNDASVAVILDHQGKAHVWFGRMRVLEDAGETNMSYFPGTDGLYYWNESMTEPGIVAFAQDIDNDNVLNVSAWGTYQTSLTSFPSAGIDAAGNIYLAYGSIYEGIAEEGTAGNGKSFRHTYVLKSSDGGLTWCGPINVVSPDNSEQYDYFEGVFGALGKRVDGSVHLIYQKDNAPGHALSSGGVDAQTGNESEIVYVNIPVNQFDAFTVCDSLFFDLASVGINEKAEVLSTVELYPNPAKGAFNLTVNVTKSEKVTIAITNMLGQQLIAFDEQLVLGNNKLTVNTTGLKSGVYFVKTTVKNKVAVKKLIIE